MNDAHSDAPAESPQEAVAPSASDAPAPETAVETKDRKAVSYTHLTLPTKRIV